MSAKFLPVRIICQTAQKHTGTVIFFHGSGSTGDGIMERVKNVDQDFSFPHLKVLFPTAPLRPYIPLKGELSNVWFNRLDISPDTPEDTDTLTEVGKDVIEFINNEAEQSCIPQNRIVVGGFSMGGALALHTGLHLMPELAGVFALSTFLSKTSSLYELPKKDGGFPPLFMCHGDRDELVPHQWGETTFTNLTTKLGVQGNFHTILCAVHELQEKEIAMLKEWLNERLPPT